MKIAVNARLLIKDKLSGLGWFAYHTLKRIVKAHPEHQFVFLFDRKFDPEFNFGPNVIPEVVFPPTRHPLLWYLWFEHAIVGRVKRHNPDLFFSPDGYLSTKIPNIPSVPVIHDLNFHHGKDRVPRLAGIYLRYYFPKFAKFAARIITVSEFSKKDISAYYQITPEKIDVAYNGADEKFRAMDEKEKIQVKLRYTGGLDYFVYVGVLVPRKNIASMIIAFDRFKKASGSPLKLVIVGDRMFFTPEMKKAYDHSVYKYDIIFTGRLEQDELVKVMGAALSLILVSKFEGFGIPVIEAMYCDVPVIASNISSLPEITGNSALMADPFSIDSICEAMTRMNSDEKLREKLISYGRIQRSKFSWENTAGEIWKSIEKSVTI
ncbi:MAG: glycosyltransferase family 4 protein [Bacteroidales bacterium]|nr:glycosyltransferase family 4 protein [Bacteroidales bacterium]